MIPNDFEIIDPNDEVFMFKNNKIKEDLVEVNKNVKKVNEKVQMIEKIKNQTPKEEKKVHEINDDALG